MSYFPAAETNTEFLNMASSLKESSQLFGSKLITLHHLYSERSSWLFWQREREIAGIDFPFLPIRPQLYIVFAPFMWHLIYIVLDKEPIWWHSAGVRAWPMDPLGMPYSTPARKLTSSWMTAQRQSFAMMEYILKFLPYSMYQCFSARGKFVPWETFGKF